MLRSRSDAGDERFAQGELIVHRNVRHGCVGWVRPVRVVDDDARGLFLWLARVPRSATRSPRTTRATCGQCRWTRGWHARTGWPQAPGPATAP
jgi:hypothetical protein